MCVQLFRLRKIIWQNIITTRPIAISRVLQANSDGPTNGLTDKRTDKAAYSCVHATKKPKSLQHILDPV